MGQNQQSSGGDEKAAADHLTSNSLLQANLALVCPQIYRVRMVIVLKVEQ